MLFLKVHSRGAVAATAFLPQCGQSVHTVRQQQWQSNTQCKAKYVVLPLLQLHRMGLEPIYLQRCCHSCCRKYLCEWLHLLQWNPIDNGTVAATVAAPCERTLTSLEDPKCILVLPWWSFLKQEPPCYYFIYRYIDSTFFFIHREVIPSDWYVHLSVLNIQIEMDYHFCDQLPHM